MLIEKLKALAIFHDSNSQSGNADVIRQAIICLQAADRMAEVARELLAAMRRYEMDVCEDPPFVHRQMVTRAEAALTAYQKTKETL